MELIFQEYKLEDETINFSIHHNTFNGITGKDKDKILEIISLIHNYKGRIIINHNEEPTKADKIEIKWYKIWTYES